MPSLSFFRYFNLVPFVNQAVDSACKNFDNRLTVFSFVLPPPPYPSFVYLPRFKGKPLVLSFAGRQSDDEAVLIWSREANEVGEG